jgi:hypothetical protein
MVLESFEIHVTLPAGPGERGTAASLRAGRLQPISTASAEREAGHGVLDGEPSDRRAGRRRGERRGPARWHVVSDRLDPSEAIQFDALAMWRELGHGHKCRESEGFLVLTDRRLLFATSAHGVHFDEHISSIKNAWVTRMKLRLVHLEVETWDRHIHAFWTAKRPAWLVVGAVHGDA